MSINRSVKRKKGTMARKIYNGAVLTQGCSAVPSSSMPNSYYKQRVSTADMTIDELMEYFRQMRERTKGKNEPDTPIVTKE